MWHVSYSLQLSPRHLLSVEGKSENHPLLFIAPPSICYPFIRGKHLFKLSLRRKAISSHSAIKTWSFPKRKTWNSKLHRLNLQNRLNNVNKFKRASAYYVQTLQFFSLFILDKAFLIKFKSNGKFLRWRFFFNFYFLCMFPIGFFFLTKFENKRNSILKTNPINYSLPELNRNSKSGKAEQMKNFHATA